MTSPGERTGGPVSRQATPPARGADLAEGDRDIDQMLALNVAEYGPTAPRASTDVVGTRGEFHWRRDENPAGRAVIPVIRDGRGDVSGCIWLIPLRVRVRRQDYHGATGANLVIDPASRGTFALVKLLRRFERALADGGVALHFSFVAEPVQRRLRAEDPDRTFTVPLLVKPLDLARLAGSYPARAWQRAIGRRLGWVASPLFLGRPAPRGEGEVRIETVQQFDDTFDEFWRRVRDRYPAMVIRDRAFLQWRFAPIGDRRYHILAAHGVEGMLGYAVTRCATVRGVETGLILDLMVLDGPRGLEAGFRLVAEAEALFRRRKMWLMTCLVAPGTAEHRILTRSGCRNLALMNPRPFRFAFFIHDSHRQDLQTLSVKDWFVTFADFESL
jgi:hypothetical protein